MISFIRQSTMQYIAKYDTYTRAVACRLKIDYPESELFLCKHNKLRNLVVVDVSVGIGVDRLHDTLGLPVAQPSSGGVDGLLELLHANPAVAVAVKFLQPFLQLFEGYFNFTMTVADSITGFKCHLILNCSVTIYVCIHLIYSAYSSHKYNPQKRVCET